MQTATIPDFFERPLPNVPIMHFEETLYSWCAIASRLSGIPTSSGLSRRLFGVPYSALAHDIPSDLLELERRTQGLLPTPDRLATQHSVLGFYLPFVSTQIRARVEAHYESGAHRDIKYDLGLPASRVGALHPLKACVVCIEKDLGQLGYAYWHAPHQFPGVWVCLHHQQPLRTLRLDKSPRHHRRWFLPHDALATQWSAYKTAESDSSLNQLALFAERLTTLAPSYFSVTQLTTTYRSELKRQGLLTEHGSLRLKPLIARVNDKYRNLRHIPDFRALNGITADWSGFLGTLARQPHRVTHPLKHLLLIALLFEGWEDFIRAYARPGEPFPKATSTTPTPIDPRPLEFVRLVSIEGLSVTAAAKTVGVTATTGIRWAKLNGLRYTTRAKTVTDRVLANCREQLRNGTSKADVASANAVSLTTITRLLSSEPQLRKEWQSAIFHHRRTTYRAEFTALINKHPGVPLKLLRKQTNNRYAWLYRHDRIWLSAHLPQLGFERQTPEN